MSLFRTYLLNIMRNATEAQPENREPDNHGSDMTRLLTAFAASIAVHGVAFGIFTARERIDAVSEGMNASLVTTYTRIQRALTDLSEQPSFESKAKEQLKQSWREQLEKDPELSKGFDYGNFFLSLSWIAGDIGIEELAKDKEYLRQRTTRYKNLAQDNPKDAKSVIGKIIQEQFGEYAEWSATLHGLVGKGKGNCDARAQMLISLISEIFPNVNLKVQVSRQAQEKGSTDQLHTTVLASIDGNWHRLEPGMPVVTMKDLEGTAVFDPSQYVKAYLDPDGVGTDVVKQQEKPNENNLDPIVSDAIVTLPVDPSALSSKEQKPVRVFKEIEFVFEGSDMQKQPKQEPTQEQQFQKRPLTDKEITNAALNKEVVATPDIESLEPLRGLKIHSLELKADDEKHVSVKDGERVVQWPSLEPISKTDIRKFMIRQKIRGITPIIDLSLLEHTAAEGYFVITTNNSIVLQELLKCPNIVAGSLLIREENVRLENLSGMRVAESLTIFAIGSTLDLAGIDKIKAGTFNLFVAAPNIKNPQALRDVEFGTFDCYPNTLSQLQGTIVEADKVVIHAGPEDEKVEDIRLSDMVKTKKVGIKYYEGDPPPNILQMVAGMDLDELTLISKKIGKVDLSPLRGMKLKRLYLSPQIHVLSWDPLEKTVEVHELPVPDRVELD